MASVRRPAALGLYPLRVRHRRPRGDAHDNKFGANLGGGIEGFLTLHTTFTAEVLYHAVQTPAIGPVGTLRIALLEPACRAQALLLGSPGSRECRVPSRCRPYSGSETSALRRSAGRRGRHGSRVLREHTGLVARRRRTPFGEARSRISVRRPRRRVGASATSMVTMSPSRTGGERTAARRLGRHMADHQAARRAGKAAVGDERDRFAESSAHDRGGHAEHLAHARAAARPLVANHDDIAGPDCLTLHRGERGLLAVEHPRGTAVRAALGRPTPSARRPPAPASREERPGRRSA